MKEYWRSGGTAPSIFDLGIRWRWVVSFTPGEKAPGTHWIGHGGVEKNSQPLSGLEHPIIQSVAQRQTTELFLEAGMFIFTTRSNKEVAMWS
jgi:hypothetical protein